MNAPGLPLTSGLVMARVAGVEDPKIDLAGHPDIKRIVGKEASTPPHSHE